MAEFLYETRLFPEPAYTFKHALTQEVAYNSLLLERRRVLHARIVETIEALAPERVAEQGDRLAHHALRGEVWDKAVPYCQQAGARANDCAAFREAVAYFEQALQALAHLPEHGAIRVPPHAILVDRYTLAHLPGHGTTRVLAIDFRIALGGPLVAMGEHRRRLALLGEAEVLARALDDRARLGRVLAGMTSSLWQTGDSNGAIAVGWQALDLAVEIGDSALQVQASHYLGEVYCAIRNFGQAAELLRRNVEAVDRGSGTPSTDWRLRSQAWLARAMSALGAFAEGRRHGEEALRLATLEGRGNTPITAHGCLGDLYLAQGDLEHAIQVYDQGLALCRASGNWNWLPPIRMGLGYAYALQGRLTEGRALMEEAISENIRTGTRSAGHWARLSEVCRLVGRGEEAWQHACQALDLARQQRRGEEIALYQLGVVHAHADPPDIAQAEAYYQQALALAEALDMRPLQAHCHHGLGTLYARTGQQEQACAELSAAITLYRAMDMTFWLPQAEAALMQVSACDNTPAE